jgi:tetratricopeptide (TPR) repeat protein
MDAQEYANAAYNYGAAYKVQLSPAFEGTVNHSFPYYAGYLYAVDGQNNPESYVKGAEALNQALAAGYVDEKGDIYYYLFHCCYGQKEADKSKLLKSKEVLLQGIDKFPKNERILNSLMQLYTVEEGMGNPEDLVALIEKALENDPKNADLWFGRGRVFNALKNYEECVASFEKCAELRPNDFEANYFVGYFIVEKANAAVEALNGNVSLSYEEYEVETAKINLIYAEAIPWLEKAFDINPTDAGVISYLNQLCFRLRDMDGMMDKYNKYHELYVNL